VLGAINACYAPAYAVESFVFGILVAASGVALVGRATWGRKFAIAVIAAQIPVFATTKATFLLRSGVSCIVAFASGQEAGLHIQFDVGATLNQPLTNGFSSFVGINAVALALLLLITEGRAAGEPLAVGKRRRSSSGRL
jgi:hypothetical protein